MSEIMLHLKALEDSLDEQTYRFVVAEAVAKYYIMLIRKTEKKVDRYQLLERVNLKLRSLGIDEVSYGYLRKWY
ncbi:hypothetical protein M1K46_15860 [Fictibacillus sp. WQ 8-8]|uniref:hypothetical protein n=1 Tax=Fictibacillus sp. WQ 8-8 TaxID=2938788 RepID=UPI002109B4A1|nr:hypothetical protein [Fictibacillus sp. WQ 8-8]MCQ6267133.1 hypothetical protein [Fictibacillus sp. WQ 8-8]